MVTSNSFLDSTISFSISSEPLLSSVKLLLNEEDLEDLLEEIVLILPIKLCFLSVASITHNSKI